MFHIHVTSMMQWKGLSSRTLSRFLGLYPKLLRKYSPLVNSFVTLERCCKFFRTIFSDLMAKILMESADQSSLTLLVFSWKLTLKANKLIRPKLLKIFHSDWAGPKTRTTENGCCFRTATRKTSIQLNQREMT